ncbi:MAG: RsmD family RNA methyltransferase, partial [Planctomycetes bacterium]|nr:RsmD family RNA methyltransferase [Planctomycetota bacterium]
MRIIAGKWRSRQLKRPDTAATRPMPDRIKEAIFNSLGARYGSPGALPALRVADLFAGSGSLGLEALSRGAASCCFVEDNVDALAALRLNVEALGAKSSASIAVRDAWAYGASAAGREPFDLIFLDPPYRETEDSSDDGRVAG